MRKQSVSLCMKQLAVTCTPPSREFTTQVVLLTLFTAAYLLNQTFYLLIKKNNNKVWFDASSRLNAEVKFEKNTNEKVTHSYITSFDVI